MTKVLVTGHDGYVGAVLVPLFEAAGVEVQGVDSLFFHDNTFGDAAAKPAQRHDIRDITPEDLTSFDAVVHLAGLSNDPLGNINADITYDINYHASVKLAQAAKAAGVPRFIYSSSCSMYGVAGDDFLTEDAPLNPVTAYAISKVNSERDISALADDTFSPVFLRNSTVYGVSPKLRLDLVLNNLTAWAYTTGKIQIMSDGTPWRPLLHVEDMSRAFLAAVQAPRDLIHNEAFNVGVTEHNYRIRDLADVVSEVVPDCEVVYAPQPDKDSRTYRVDFSKIKTQLGEYFQPQWDAKKGAQSLYEAFKAAQLTLDDFQGKRYIRLKTITSLLDAQQLDSSLRWRSSTGAEHG